MPAVPAPEPGCPKRMTFGPCGGVRADLRCEMAPVPCPFADRAVPVRWPDEQRGGPAPALFAGLGRPVVLTDLTVPPFDAVGLAAVVGILAGASDGLLVGEHQNRPDFPPTQMAAMVRAGGGSPWITLTCRDRNRVVLEQELAGLVHAGAAGVLCVTGDGRAPGVRPDVTQVFDLDGTRLAALAATMGLPVAVPEAPDAPPVALRPGRLREKQRAGATLCVLNHVGSVGALARFAAAARDAGVTIPMIAGVAVYTDERSASVLARFPGLHLDERQVAAVLDAPDPVRAGIAAALAEARALLAVDGVVGVNLSGLASVRGPEFAAEVKATIGRELRERGMSSADALEDEFDVHARWLRQAVVTLGIDDATAAACQGSASPAALRWLAGACALEPGHLLVDVGGGTGGPAAFARAERGVVPLVVEPMAGACQAARDLFGLPVVRGSGLRVPVATGVADAVWCLGVLCTTPDRATILAELRRVLRPGRPVGLLVFLRRVAADALADGPAGNDFPAADELAPLLADAGFTVTDTAELADLEPPPAAWEEQAAAVEREIERAHGTDPRFREAQDQQRRIARVMDDGRVVGRLLRALS